MFITSALLVLAPLLASAYKIEQFKDCNCYDPSGDSVIQHGLAPEQFRQYRLGPTTCSVYVTPEAGDVEAGLRVDIAFDAGNSVSGGMYPEPRCFRNQPDRNGRFVPDKPLYAVSIAVAEYDFATLPPIVQKRGINRLD